jgi:phage shock protein PspC (stress-responsive transcriptional regulator)
MSTSNDDRKEVAVTSPMSLLGGTGTYLDWGVVQISLANLVVIVLMIIVFIAALFIPFGRAPKPQSKVRDEGGRR